MKGLVFSYCLWYNHSYANLETEDAAIANKLELTWYGKDKPVRIEPQLLIENVELSNTAQDPDTRNMIIHGDNLLALKALESNYTGQAGIALETTG